MDHKRTFYFWQKIKGIRESFANRLYPDFEDNTKQKMQKVINLADISK